MSTTIPYSFSPNTKIRSAEVNADFEEIVAGLNVMELLEDRNNINGTGGASNSTAQLRNNILIQTGIQASNADGTEVTVTFPVAFAHNPQVFLQSMYVTVKNFAILNFVSTTTFKFYCIRADSVSDVGGTGGAETIQWLAIGVRS